MKTSYPIIKLCLRTNKILADGTHPIMLRCSWHGRKEVATHFSCMSNQLDEKNERLKKNYPNFATINQILGKQKASAIERRDHLIASGGTITPEAILSPSEEEINTPTALKSLMEEYVKEKHLGVNTTKHYIHALGVLRRFFVKAEIDINDITSERIRSLIEFEKQRGIKDSSIGQTLNSINALCTYAVEKGLINVNPFTSVKYNRTLNTSNESVYLHHTTLSFIKNELTTMLKYTPDLPLHPKSRAYPLYMFMLSVLFQGLAPVDMVILKKNQVQMKHIGSDWYYYISTKRRKTDIGVRILVKQDDYSKAMIEPLAKSSGEYLLPILSVAPTDRELAKVLNTYLQFANRCLKWWWQKLNRVIGGMRRHQIEKIPEEATLYSARHSYAQCFMSKGGNPLQLATLMGRSINGIGAYVKQLSSDIDLVEAVSNLEL